MIKLNQLKSALLKAKEHLDKRTVEIVDALTEDLKDYATTEYVDNAVNNSSGGGNVSTPDWNQNDETASDYVKNRTHWVEPGGEEILPSATYADKDVDTDGFLLPFFELHEGKTYEVTFEGTVYVCMCSKYRISASDIYVYWLGNLDVPLSSESPSLGKDTGEPFLILVNASGDAPNGVVVPRTGHATPVTLGIKSASIVHHLDPKYIKDMYYSEFADITILPETEATFTEGAFNGMDAFVIMSAPTLEVGKTYTVNYNRVEYNSVAVDGGLMGFTGGIILGDIYTATGGQIGTYATGEPFIFMSMPSMGASGVMPIGGDTSVTFGITGEGEKVNKIPNKYLDLEWLPTYTEGEITVVEEAETRVNGGIFTNLHNYYEAISSVMTEGAVLKLNVADTLYEGTVKYVSYNGIDVYYVGNVALVESVFPNTGESFVIAWFNDMAYICVDGLGSVTVTWSLYSIVTVPNKLPEEFLPDSNSEPYIIEGVSKTDAYAVSMSEWTAAQNAIESGRPVLARVGDTLCTVLSVYSDNGMDGYFRCSYANSGTITTIWGQNTPSGGNIRWSEYSYGYISLGNDTQTGYGWTITANDGTLHLNRNNSNTKTTLATTDYVDSLFNEYITEVDTLLGGDA